MVGGGHNGLVAAILLAGAGLRVRVLERADQVGGAVAGLPVFAGRAARLSRYAYLVSLFPAELAAQLGVALPLRRRPVASYTPVVLAGGRARGLLVEQEPGAASAESFAEVTGSAAAWSQFRAWQRRLAGFAEVVGPTLTGPLPGRDAVRAAVTARCGAGVWDDLVERPIGAALERDIGHDLVRGVLATDALIGTHASVHDLRANRCYAYHVIGRGTGEWLVPEGGMGAVADALRDAARAAGVRLITGAEVVALRAGDDPRDRVSAELADGSELAADWALAGCAPAVLDRLLGRPAGQPPEGSQLKVNLLLTRLPRLRSGVDPAVAFAGTLHLEEGYDYLERAFRLAEAGRPADPLPAEVYCHTLTDPSILAPELVERGWQTLTLFGLHCPARLFRSDGTGVAGTGEAEAAAEMRRRVVDAALRSLQEHLAEPLAGVLATDGHGRPCVDVATPADLEESLAMPGGHIFHGDLEWPWLPADEPAGDDPAGRWGVAVPGYPRVVMAGAGSRRGGGVSGLGGLHAARAVLDTIADRRTPSAGPLGAQRAGLG